MYPLSSARLPGVKLAGPRRKYVQCLQQEGELRPHEKVPQGVNWSEKDGSCDIPGNVADVLFWMRGAVCLTTGVSMAQSTRLERLDCHSAPSELCDAKFLHSSSQSNHEKSLPRYQASKLELRQSTFSRANPIDLHNDANATGLPTSDSDPELFSFKRTLFPVFTLAIGSALIFDDESADIRLTEIKLSPNQRPALRLELKKSRTLNMAEDSRGKARSEMNIASFTPITRIRTISAKEQSRIHIPLDIFAAEERILCLGILRHPSSQDKIGDDLKKLVMVPGRERYGQMNRNVRQLHGRGILRMLQRSRARSRFSEDSNVEQLAVQGSDRKSEGVYPPTEPARSYWWNSKDVPAKTGSRRIETKTKREKQQRQAQAGGSLGASRRGSNQNELCRLDLVGRWSQGRRTALARARARSAPHQRGTAEVLQELARLDPAPTRVVGVLRLRPGEPLLVERRRSTSRGREDGGGRREGNIHLELEICLAVICRVVASEQGFEPRVDAAPRCEIRKYSQYLGPFLGATEERDGSEGTGGRERDVPEPIGSDTERTLPPIHLSARSLPMLYPLTNTEHQGNTAPAPQLSRHFS
ncbi:hypothetical protein DFH07DRAFT_770677 [Mycena maculata]|uniref:Uncharacterized protein n=1 Tax=Mycena maculata TaxID=230809 RepID=A0AAD7JIB4_9AGAR|nr:hypothetical protein DFH07DRAFT_770677 [Mycena maculata]